MRKINEKGNILLQVLSGERVPLDFLFPKRFFEKHTGISNAPPAYMYHQADPAEFKSICAEIRQIEIKTLTFSDILKGSWKKEKALILTFDDGWSSVWSMAFPIARRFGISFTLFVVPEAIEDSLECRSTLQDKKEKVESLIRRDFGKRPMLTWGEVRAMHESGLVDVQSHTLNHGVVFTSDKLIGFSSPAGPFPINRITPLISWTQGKDVAELLPAMGTPLYPWGPALASSTRFKDDTNKREECISIVQKEGGTNFFTKVKWKASLEKVVNNNKGGRWETDNERTERCKNDLAQAKRLIEERLAGAKVGVVALPWGTMHPEIPHIAHDTGHDICVLAYPFPKHFSESSVLLYPRLFGDSIWTLLWGPIRGGFKWLQMRKKNIMRGKYGAIP